ncbi:MAG TPA: multiheme c-type cytochrome [Tepidisphaeraceae bacterium]|nr:multiheme c-type cytochrome [Tepidisphaeraceae bacterium]
MRSLKFTRRTLPRIAAVFLAAMAPACAGWLAGCGNGNSAESARSSPSSSSAAPIAPITLSVQPASNPYDAHANLFVETRFPSAMQCGKCHPTQFRQWSVSQHSYAQLSPIFNAMQATIDKGTNGTNGDFCIRCHTQVGMTLGEKEFMSNVDRNPVSREGVTCVVCHRLNEPLGKISGRFPLAEGELTEPVYGPTGRNGELKKAIASEDLVTEPATPGKKVHGQTRKFFRITTSAFCGSCHDVTLFNGFRLEEAFSEYKHSPAARAGVQCQDCHMGKEPGRRLAEKDNPNFDRINYAFGPAAKVGDFETAPRKLANHMFVGPDYSVVPPWLFPHRPGAIKDEHALNGPASHGLATIPEWMKFGWKQGWGTPAFEKNLAGQTMFPPRWAAAVDRIQARKIIDENQKLLDEMSRNRMILQRNGYKLGDIVVKKADRDGITFAVQVKNGTDGHGVPTGFDVERLVWVHVSVQDATGKIIKESGDLDPDGDVRDHQAMLVRSGQEPLDDELLSLQGHFLVHLQRGSEREQVLSTNYSPSPLPFLRPERMSSILQGRPSGARKQKENIEPLGERWATYHVTALELTGNGPYTAIVQLKTAMVPVNLVHEVRKVGFDFELSEKQIVESLRAGHRVVWEKRVNLKD